MNLNTDILPLTKEQLAAPPLSTTPKSRSCASIAIALDKFLHWLQISTPQRSPQYELACEGANMLSQLRKAVVRSTMPVYANIDLYLPLDEDPIFLAYIKDQQTNHHRQVLPLPFLPLPAAQLLDESTPPLFFDPFTQSYKPFVSTTTETDHQPPSPVSNPPTTPVGGDSPVLSAEHQAYLGRITTSPTLTLRAMVWKSFILGPLLLSRISLGEVCAEVPPPFTTQSRLSRYVPGAGSTLAHSTVTTSGSHTGQNDDRFLDAIASPSDETTSLFSISTDDGSSTASIPHSVSVQGSVTIAPEPKLYATAEDYAAILQCHVGPLYGKVRDDSFRTFRTAQSFTRSVPEQVLVRLLNAFDVQYQSNWAYCQGINVIAGMFAYVMPELDAYNCFSLFCTKFIPFYWRSNHIAVEAGCVLLHKIVELTHPEITEAISRVQGLTSLVYAYPFVKTLSGAAIPLDEVVHLWDAQLAMGEAFALLAVASQVISCPHVLDPAQTKSVLDYRKWPELRAQGVIAHSFQLLQELSTVPQFEELYAQLSQYSTDPQLITVLTNRQPYAKQ